MEPPVEQPPVSTTSLPVDAVDEPVVTAKIKPPVLASDILREEVAPIAPAQGALRIWLAAFAIAFAAGAAASWAGFGPRSPGVVTGCLATAFVALLAATLPVPYAVRASLAAVSGLVPLAMGVRSEGPLAALGFEGTGHAAALLVLTTLLPGALLFRARYRAFRAARVLLVLALAASAYGLVILVMHALSPDASFLARAADAGLACAALTAFFGFLGEETTGACTAWAVLLVAAYTVRLGLQTVVESGDPYGRWGFLVGALGASVSGMVVAFAVLQLLATLLANEARKVDVHRIVGPSAEETHGSERPPSMSSEG